MVRRTLMAAACVLALGWAATETTRASDQGLYKTHLTFSGAVALPGVTLGAGTYVFERPLDGVANLIRVRSVDGQRTFLTTLTDRVARPSGMDRHEQVSFGEARLGQARPIAAWWPADADHGYAFRYR